MTIRHTLSIAVLAPVLALGCGSSGPPRFAAQGELSLGGELPVIGEILFIPDTSKGNSGPGTRAEVRNGQFSLPAEKGHIGGPHRLKITLYDGNSRPAEMLPHGDLVLGNHFVERDLPTESGTLNISLLPLEELLAADRDASTTGSQP